MTLNNPQWGRNPQGEEEKKDHEPQRETPQQEREPEPAQPKQQNQKPAADNDLDQLWREFNDVMGSILKNKPAGEGNGNPPPGGRDSEPPISIRPPKASPLQAGLIALIAVLGWGASGFYIVPEGQVGVVTTFGKYTSDTQPGINWRLPYPVQQAELVDISSVRKAEIGIRGSAQRLKEALMLTDDENIVDVMFNVQYRIKPGAARDYLFRTKNPDRGVVQVAESAMREVVGRKTMDSVLFESKQEIAEAVKRAMQSMLDKYHTGIEVMSVAIQNAQPPQQVQAAFNDAVKAGQDRERQINEGEAYANSVIPKAKGLAARLTQEADGYKARVIETATGDAARFSKVLDQYEKAPRVTRDRLYIDTMRDVYTNSSKIYVDTKGNNNLLWLPVDKLQQMAQPSADPVSSAGTAAEVKSAEPSTDLDQDTVRRLRSR